MWAKKGQSGGKNLKILFLGVILAFIELDESLTLFIIYASL